MYTVLNNTVTGSGNAFDHNKRLLLDTTARVEVFKTNVITPGQAAKLNVLLLQQFPHCRINFDLEDCDKILRMVTRVKITGKVIAFISKQGFTCEELF
jgi:hypothetical protein